MCGICGFVNSGADRAAWSSPLAAMMKALYHRGPDDGGMWFDEQHGAALGHRRLSIVDLSTAGHQPMESADGRLVMVFNGEIYNHLELRKRLDASGLTPPAGWRGHSDTEVLLACLVAWGIEETLNSTVGMFALAVWDNDQKSLTLARDRIGEKPLYYGWNRGIFLFGSELKALRAHPSFNSELNWFAANSFLHLNYIPAPTTIYQGIHKLVPGTFLCLTEADIAVKGSPTPIPYWSLRNVALHGLANPFEGTFQDAVDELEILVRRAVQLQSVADVPVGAFLSGGIDSSTVVAMMQTATTSKVTTFSIGMPDAAMDESKHAAKVAKYLGTNHVYHIIQPREALDLIPRLPEIWDEPFADSSQIPLYFVSQLARRTVTVALSGDGGDELFLGYPQYAFYQKLWGVRSLAKFPWDVLLAAFLPWANNEHVGTALRRAKSVVSAWGQPDTQALNRYWMDRYRQDNIPLTQQRGEAMLNFPILPDAATTAGLWDAGTSLPDDILVKVDRAAMANSLETRAPLLDHRIVEFSYRLPLAYKLNNGINKKALRAVLYRHVPRLMVERPKMGFSIPLTSWLRQELRPWAESLLGTIQNDSEYFNKSAINVIWSDHLSGRRNNTEKLWGILMLLQFLK